MGAKKPPFPAANRMSSFCLCLLEFLVCSQRKRLPPPGHSEKKEREKREGINLFLTMYMLPEDQREMVSKLVLNCKRFVKGGPLSFPGGLCYTGDILMTAGETLTPDVF